MGRDVRGGLKGAMRCRETDTAIGGMGLASEARFVPLPRNVNEKVDADASSVAHYSSFIHSCNEKLHNASAHAV